MIIMSKDKGLKSSKDREFLSGSAREMEEAIQEAKDIMTGKIASKTYGSAQELFDELDAE